MTIPIISVITTIYNCEKFLPFSIESILNQTFEDFEFIIINDGSTDSCKDIVLSYSDKRIKFIDNLDNQKIPTRRNQGIHFAQGQYVSIHDGDDWSFPERLKKQIEIITSNDLFCVGGHAKKIDLENQEIEEMTYPPEKHDDIVKLVIKKCMNPMIDPSTMFKRSDFLLLGDYTLDKSIYTVPDFDLWMRAILKNKRFYNIQEPIIKYRQNPNGMTNEHKKEMIPAHMQVWRKFMTQYFKDNYEKLKRDSGKQNETKDLDNGRGTNSL